MNLGIYIPADLKANYAETFKKFDVNHEKFITNEAAKQIFSRANLPERDVNKIM